MLRWVILSVVALTAMSPCFAEISGRAFVKGRPTGDVVVWLDVAAPAPSTPPHALMDQRNLTFFPHVLAVRVGTIVDFPNHDRVFHNVFSYHDGHRFDLGLYPYGATRHVPFTRTGLSRLFCDIHPSMAAYIMVLNTPCFAVSRTDGRFDLPSVPAGRYTYHAWRPGADEISGSAAFSPGRPFELQCTD